MSYKRYWVALFIVIVASFAVLGGEGRKMISQAPPLPDVYTTNGQLLFTGSSITDGQGVWQSIGGQEIGTVWGHGAYVAPDWTADWLHRESEILLNIWAVRDGASNFAALGVDQQAILKARLIREIRTNTYDATRHRIVIDADRVAAFRQLSAYYADVFASGRAEYAIPKDALTNNAKQHELGEFFWWTAWAAGTDRPGSTTTYTNNWPHEPLIANGPTPGVVLWSVLSFIGLLAGIGGLVWWYASQEKVVVHGPYPATDPFLEHQATPSQRATIKFFLVAIILWGVQIMMGILTAHYGVEGHSFYGFPLDHYLPYAVTRTWHLQLAIFWIATSWLATGLYVGPAVSGHEPKYQRLGVNVLFGALIVVVGGSLAGEWLGIQQRLGNMWFWFGSQGYEYVDLGRFWQILLFIGLVLWLVLMVAALKPALVRKSEDQPLLILFLISSIAIPLFYAAGLMYGQRSNLVTAEYWRWWVVHLWVEGFFEVFATVVIGFLFTRLKLIEIRTATKAALFSTSIFLSGGIIGTFHHLYFAGATPAVIGLGAIFSAFEVVPLTLIGYEAWENLRIAQPPKGSRWIGQLSVAHLLLRGSRILEPGGSWTVRLPHQPADFALLRAGAKPHSPARPYCPLRRVRNARARPHALLPAYIASWTSVEAGNVEDFILVPEYRPQLHGPPQHASDWAATGLGIDPVRHMVCTVRRVHADELNADPALDASSRRHPVLHRSSIVRMVCSWSADWAFL